MAATLLCSLGLAGCSVAPATTTAAEVAYPVMVGMVPRIAGSPAAYAAGGRPFEVEAKSIHHRIPQWNQYYAKTTNLVADADILGKELETLAATYPNRKVRVRRIEVGSAMNGWWFLGVVYGGYMKAENSIKVEGSLEGK